ncbi:hypothetical protein AAFN88_14265 [Pelagibius sp. CAU 1746]|uniref:hypothetical protein n=1 Tax=Pelagibius sp. CAU 1746 TaxID=3140370 RepID=UPI00325BD8FA
MITTRQSKSQTAAQASPRSSSFWQNLSGALGGSGDRRSLFSRRGANPDQVKAGRVFRHDDGSGRQETATVIGLCEILGMTHVRYDLRIDQPGHRPFEDGPRVLGMKTFLDHFCEPVSS